MDVVIEIPDAVQRAEAPMRVVLLVTLHVRLCQFANLQATSEN